MSAHEDVLIGGFTDTYYNQTVKSITMLKWFEKFCNHTQFLLKLNGITDPSSLSTHEFYKLIRGLQNRDDILLGSINTVPMAERQEKILGEL